MSFVIMADDRTLVDTVYSLKDQVRELRQVWLSFHLAVE